MTESEWLACSDPTAMLDSLRGKASDRKLRLFAVACCRRYWDLPREERSRTAVLVAERLADGLATREELEEARWEANWTAGGGDGFGPERCCMDLDGRPYDSAMAASVIEATFDILESRKIAAELAGLPRSQWVKSHAGLRNEQWVAECRAVADLIRDIFGNPFRHASVDPTWLAPCVVNLARTIYGERAFDRTPDLADALEEAECHDADILGHCLHQGPHVRGCWVSGRKLRLFAVACCRNVWDLISDQRSRDAVELAERFANGQATEMERSSAQIAAEAAVAALYPAHEDYAASAAAIAVSEDASADINADAAAFTAAEAANTDDDPTDETIWVAEPLRQAALLLDIFGNPSDPCPSIPTWAIDTVRDPAQAIYEDRTLPSGHLDGRRMSLLADALEEAGCHDSDVLGHCRQPGPHVRGCWVVDAVLGKSS